MAWTLLWKEAVAATSPFPLLSVLVALALAGCERDVPRRLQPPPGDAPPVETVLVPEKLTSIESGGVDALGRPLRVPCVTCHSLKEPAPMPRSPEQLQAFHRGLQFRHGDNACTSCHQADAPQSLHLATGEPLPMTEVVTLCSQCHGPQARDFRAGAHGGMTGYWDASRGGRTRNNCVSCHDPHAPKYAGALPVMPPRPLHPPPESHAHE
ncbi:hypothetical protein [Pyxidicoccus sp. MSG2]|uniref:hypothetical protein n=1 Tax=Pyxidicoccus sp. MSG2 TaxID=2996790 RepID=UPI00226FB38B|nr:hypothetical protein [Pyxidicoccus sp. MSG2]MCY1022774.1 hypothetical protein [Pyxidicoccus sp. MSG2]